MCVKTFRPVNSIFSSGAPLMPMSNVMGSPVDPDQFIQFKALSSKTAPLSSGLGMHFHPVPRCWWNCQLRMVKFPTSTVVGVAYQCVPMCTDDLVNNEAV